MRHLPLLAVLFSLSALAEGAYVGELDSAAGATVNLALKKGAKYELQCNAAARFRTGAGNTTAASNTPGATYGRKVDVDQLLEFATEVDHDYVAIIPISGAGKCWVWARSAVR